MAHGWYRYKMATGRVWGKCKKAPLLKSQRRKRPVIIFIYTQIKQIEYEIIPIEHFNKKKKIINNGILMLSESKNTRSDNKFPGIALPQFTAFKL